MDIYHANYQQVFFILSFCFIPAFLFIYTSSCRPTFKRIFDEYIVWQIDNTVLFRGKDWFLMIKVSDPNPEPVSCYCSYQDPIFFECGIQIRFNFIRIRHHALTYPEMILTFISQEL